MAAEAAGFEGLTFMDISLLPWPTTRTCGKRCRSPAWILGRTTTLTVGHLVLCDGLRHPAVLARQVSRSTTRQVVVSTSGSARDQSPPSCRPSASARRIHNASIDSANRLPSCEHSGPETSSTFMGSTSPSSALSSAGPDTTDTDHDRGNGEANARTRARVRGLVERPATPVRPARRAERRSRSHAGLGATDGGGGPVEVERHEVTRNATRRFGGMHPVIGTTTELAVHFAGLHARGVDRFYVWFADFAPVSTLECFAAIIESAQ